MSVQGWIRSLFNHGAYTHRIGYDNSAGVDLVGIVVTEAEPDERIAILTEIVGRLVDFNGQSLDHMLELSGLDARYEVCADPDVELMRKLNK